MSKLSEIKLKPIYIFLSLYLSLNIGISVIVFYNQMVAQRETFDFKTDYVNFYTGPTLIKNGQIQELYNYETQNKVQSDLLDGQEISTILAFRSLPSVGYLLLPFAYLDFMVGMKLFILINLGLLHYVVYKYSTIKHEHALDSQSETQYTNFKQDLNYRTTSNLPRGTQRQTNEQQISTWNKTDFLFYTMLLWSFYPLTIAIKSAQIATLMACGVGGICLILATAFKSPSKINNNLLTKNKAIVVGLLASTMWIKLQFLILIPFVYVILSSRGNEFRYSFKSLRNNSSQIREWLMKNQNSETLNFLKGLLIGTLLFLGIGIQKVGFYFDDYLKFIINSENVEHGTQLQVVSSLQGFLHYIVGDNLAFASSVAIIAILYPALLYVYSKTQHKMDISVSLLVAVMLTLSLNLHSFITDYLMLIFPMILIFKNKKYVLFFSLHGLMLLNHLHMQYIYPLIYILISAGIMLAHSPAKEEYIKSKLMLKLFAK